MPREICRCQEMVEAEATPPCITCAERPTCFINLAQRQLFERGSSEVNKRHIVSDCDGYRPINETQARRKDIRWDLLAAGVTDLCVGCQEGGEGNCADALDLEQIEMVAASHGINIHFTVFTCHTKSPKLLQIGEVRGK